MAELYDVEVGLAEAVQFRRRRDSASRAQVTLADRLARHLIEHFEAADNETAGQALVVGAASVGALPMEDVPPSAIVNILALAGQRMVADAREERREIAREIRDDRTRDAAGVE